MNEELNHILVEICRLDRSRPLLVGFSGGADSQYLAGELHALGWKLIIAHFDHALRPDSAVDAEEARRFAARLQAPFVTAREDVGVYAQRSGLSLEEAARNRRYRFLFAQAETLEIQAVAVAHTANDQVETVLMHFLRGSGLSGLAGMSYSFLPNPWSRTIPLVRPLLGIWREEIDAENERQGRRAIEDPSNRDLRFYRNRLRHELLPYLAGYNPAIRSVLWRTADVLREDESLLENLTREAWERCGFTQGEGWVSFSPQTLLAQPFALQRRLLRRGISCLRPGLRDIGLQTVDRGLEFLRQGEAQQTDLSSGLFLLRDGPRVYLASWEADLPRAAWPQLDTEAELFLDVPGGVPLAAGWRLNARIEPVTGGQPPAGYGDPYQAWLDVETLQRPLQVRTRRPGDRIQPLGMENGSQKISDLMINAKLPERARSRWPLLLSGDEVAWVPGVRMAQTFRLRPDTTRAVHLVVSRPESG